MPLKSPDSTKINQQSTPSVIAHETLSEMDTTSSSEGILSVPGKSPGVADSTIVPRHDQHTESFDAKNDSSQAPVAGNSAPPQGESERHPSVALGSQEESKPSPVLNRKERLRIVIQIPRDSVGRFIGKQGRNIKALMADSNGAYVYVNQKNLPNDAQFVLCTVQGTQSQVDEAVRIIEAKYPEIDTHLFSPFTSLNFSSPSSSVPKPGEESWDVKLPPALIPSTSFSGMVSNIESLTKIWLVSSEKMCEMDKQHDSMVYAYSQVVSSGSSCLVAKERETSLLGKVCAVRVTEIHWMRGRVIRFSDNLSGYVIQLVDYGGMMEVPPSSVRPLR